MSQYLLPCECGNSLSVKTQQAGESMQCKCGKTLRVPDLRSLRQLPRAGADLESQKKTWSPVRGVVFGIGFGVFLLGTFCLGLFGFKRSQLDLTPPDLKLVKQFQTDLSKITPTYAWNLWKDVEYRPLYRTVAPVYQQNRVRVSWLNKLMAVAGLAGFVGLAMAVGSTFVGRTVSRPQKKV